MQGTICVICGTSLAAITAFSVSRGVGKKLAQRVVSEELKSETSEQSAVVESKFKGIQDAIDQGSFAQQSIAVAVLRLTPVVPFRCYHGSFCLVYVQSHLLFPSLA
jgi:uncharacterized membrane protein YdjX (TVP38/TMEM64 family)